MNKLFEVYTDKEREQSEKEFQNDYNKVKDIITSTEIVTIRKQNNCYVGYTDNNYMIPLKSYQDQLKARQKYKVYMNDYQRVVRIERVK